MIVRELRTILDHLPDDMEVHISSGHARSCHVSRVERSTGFVCSTSLPGSRYAVDERAPGAVQIVGTIGWWWPPPDYELRGPFRRRAELLAELDPDVPA